MCIKSSATMLKTILIYLATLHLSLGDTQTKSPTGALQPLDSECVNVQRAFRNVIYTTTECMFVSMEQIDCPLLSSDQPILAITMDQMFNGYVFNYQQTKFCEIAVLFLKDFRLFRNFIRNRSLKYAFKPYTRIAIITTGQDAFDGVFDSKMHKQWILLNAVTFALGRIYNSTHYEMRDVLSNKSIIFSNRTQLGSYVVARKTNLLHPLFDKNVPGRVFKVSLFHCSPHVIKLNDGISLDSYDGAEIRFVKEIVGDWNVTIYDRKTVTDPYQQVYKDIETETADMGMCSIWLTAQGYKRRVEVSNYYSYLCGTFLVPKPVQIVAAPYIYLPFRPTVWWITGGTLLVTTILYFILNLLLDEDPEQDRWEILIRAFLDIFNIVTSHGVPKIVLKIPIQLLLISWLLLSFLLITAYSAKYQSILALPFHTKPVDNLQDFLDAGLFWGEVGERKAWMENFRSSGDPALMQMPSRFIVEKDSSERLKYIPTGKYANYVTVLSNNYITDTETFPHLAHHLRLMKTCVSNYYTIFPFVKNSPYTKYFNRQLGRYIDAGIMDHWFRSMSTQGGHSYMAGLFGKNRAHEDSHHVPLNLNNVMGAFYLLFFGTSMAAIVFCCESFVHYRRTKANIVRKSRVREVPNTDSEFEIGTSS